MTKSNSKSSNRRSGGKAMSSNTDRRAKPMISKAGVTMHRSRYGNGGKA